RVSRLDVTFSIKLPHARLVQPCLRFLANVSQGHRRNDTDRRDFYNTVYFGGVTSPWGGAKIYGKAEELRTEINKLQTKAKTGCTESAKKLVILNDELLLWSDCVLRFESSNKRKLLEKLGYPFNLWELCRYLGSKKLRNKALIRLWQYWFSPIFKALKGNIMDSTDDNQIYDLCKEKLITYTKSGKPSLTKANNAFNFYQLLKSNGWKDVKSRYQPRAFQLNVKSLVDIGIPRGLLQNLNNQSVQVLPVVELLQLQLEKQFPADYVPPKSAFRGDFRCYLTPHLKVA
ncbi:MULTISPECIES: phage/plasmid replication protein, II/X family, partial [unclassified Moraxella]|uniref:phage/plasmid replication protein, II/X family n=1 Tax=unclassified Moraxella TaxID=2685852 RepID=UPI003AF65AB9